MAQVKSLADYRDRVAGLPADRFVGSLLWFSISGRVERTGNIKSKVAVRATTDQFYEWYEELGFEELGLDKKYLPPRINKINAFRKASSQVKCEYEIDDRRSARLRVEEIDFNDEFVLRHVMRDVTDHKGQVQVSAHVATLKFFRGGRTASGRRQGESLKTQVLLQLTEIGLDGKKTKRDPFPLPEAERETVTKFIEEIDRRYADACANLDSNAIRAVVRNYVTSLNAIPCSASGGLYFVHMSKQRALDALQEFVRRIGQGCQFVQVPLLDTAESRDMLTEAFQSEVEEQCYALLDEIREFNENVKAKGQKITPRRYAAIKARYDEIMSRSVEYTDALGLAQGRSAAALEMALDSVIDIAERMET
jgi:hypothetical protein